MLITKIEMQDDDGHTWSMSRTYKWDQFQLFRDGSSIASVEIKDGTERTWLLFNDDPEEGQYESHDDYLTALASGTHQMPCIGTMQFDKNMVQSVMEWAIECFLKHGWTTP